MLVTYEVNIGLPVPDVPVNDGFVFAYIGFATYIVSGTNSYILSSRLVWTYLNSTGSFSYSTGFCC